MVDFRVCAVVAGLALSLASGAEAQQTSNAFPTKPGAGASYSAISPTEAAELITAFGFTVEDRTQGFLGDQSSPIGNGKSFILEFKASTGAAAYLAMHNCVEAGGEMRCPALEFFGYFESAGVTLQQVNDFNIAQSAGSTVALISGGPGIIQRKKYLDGGAKAENINQDFRVFLFDFDTLVAGIQPGTLATVSFQPAPLTGKISNLTPSGEMAPAQIWRSAKINQSKGRTPLFGSGD
ncbi:MAG: hypothetical protein AAFR21_08635 [Pseudomonadota bacterium]